MILDEIDNLFAIDLSQLGHSLSQSVRGSQSSQSARAHTDEALCVNYDLMSAAHPHLFPAEADKLLHLIVCDFN